VLALVLAPLWAAAADEQRTPAAPEDRIHITSQRLVADNQARFAEFIGDVVATQGTTVIKADRLRVYYQPDSDPAQQAGQVDRIVATGSVNIKTGDKVADTPKAVYEAQSGVLTLVGPGSTVRSSGNSVTGEKITLFRNEDRMTVESGSRERVEAVFYQDQKAAPAP
jgi:lipopolysaccharide export system protein LptA